MYRLRELERKDIPTINRWRNNPELVALLGAPFRYINSEVDEKWFDMYMGNRNSTIRCSIVDSEDEPIGLVTLASVDYLNQSAELHIMIGEEGNCGKGIGTFALTRMLDHAFSNMNLQRVELAVLEENRRARALYEKVGCVEEGKKREVRYKNGKFVDMVMYSILKRDFHPQFSGGVLRILTFRYIACILVDSVSRKSRSSGCVMMRLSSRSVRGRMPCC